MRSIVSMFLLGFVLVFASRASATMTLGRLPLATVTSESGRIVHATVSDVRTGEDESGMPATWITFAVRRTVKGAAASEVTIKQFGRSDQVVGRIPGQPSFTKGEELVVFLRPESRRGFTSPVGLEDGVYRVTATDGRRTARTPGGDAKDVDAFLADVERLVTEQDR